MKVKALYESLTNEIIHAIETSCSGNFVLPWEKGGAITIPTNAVTGNSYSGINIVSLWVAAVRGEFKHGLWATFRQWKELGGSIRKGEKGNQVVFFKRIEDESESSTRGFISRVSSVFNISQVEGLVTNPLENISEADRVADVEAFFQSLALEVKESGARQAAYCRERDCVFVPPFSVFHSAQDYYRVLAHEVIHWTGHGSRLARDLSGRFGSESYAVEELVAELGAAFLCARLGLEKAPKDHGLYLKDWLRVLKRDSTALQAVASNAQAACNFVFHASEVSREQAMSSDREVAH